MGSDWFYLAKVCGAYNMGPDWFYLAREYVVPIIWVQTCFTFSESMWCLLYGFRLVLSCHRVCGACNIGSDCFYLAREYVVPIILVQTCFTLSESMWCL